jgi:hypothetical protein
MKHAESINRDIPVAVVVGLPPENQRRAMTDAISHVHCIFL